MDTFPTVEQALAVIIDEAQAGEEAYGAVYDSAGHIATSTPVRAILYGFVVLPKTAAEGSPDEALMDLLVSLIPTLDRPDHVADWPEDERDLHRHGNFKNFTERSETLALLRRRKVAAAILAAGFTRPV